MVKVAEIINSKKNIFEHVHKRNNSECCVGKPEGTGIRLGYDGWGYPDVVLDPIIPLDMCVRNLNIEGKFDFVIGNYFLSSMHGDCSLTHAARGLILMVKPGGKLLIRDISTFDVAKQSIKMFEEGNYTGGQIREKLCFPMPRDKTSLIRIQNFLSPKRILDMFLDHTANIIKNVNTSISCTIPDDVDLSKITTGDFISKNRNTISDTMQNDRPLCVICGKPSTKMDHNNYLYSKYCKDHYYEARQICDNKIISSFTFEIKILKNETDDNCTPFKKIRLNYDKTINDICQKMSIIRNNSTELAEECDNKTQEEINRLLELKKSETMIIHGNWTGPKNFDIFDFIIKFAEDNFKRIRHQKYDDGKYIVIMSNILLK